jgi:hypothetical protein
MCNVAKERIRIDKILNDAIGSNSMSGGMSQNELTQLCFAALQDAYHGACLDECLEAAAREFVVRRLAKRSDGETQPARLTTAA